MRTTRRILCCCMILAVLCGCQTEQQKKSAFKQQYNEKASPVKLTAVEAMLEQGQVESARQAVGGILKAQPENAAAWLLLGQIFLEQKNYGGARLAFEKTTSLNENTADAWFGLGVVAQSSNDHISALEYYQKALAWNPACTEAILAVANTLEILERRDEAAQFLDPKITDNPSDTKLLCAAADLANRTRQTDKAISLYRRAATLNPQDEQILRSLAMTYVFRGDWAAAADTFEKVLLCAAETDRQADYLYWVADSSLNAGRFRRALECFDKLSVVRRKDADVWLGMAQSAMGISDIKRAKICAQKALSFRNDCFEAQTVIGCADYLDGKYLTALESFIPLANNESLGGFASFMAGRCYQKLGRDVQATMAFEKAVRLNPQSPLVAMFLNGSKTKN
ncbi:MAG: tetratricopeptide repeat protein [Planctomycetes bacterium]|nr:tetratricopeptide repeat protein [Planctomycetota bacterium]